MLFATNVLRAKTKNNKIDLGKNLRQFAAIVAFFFMSILSLSSKQYVLLVSFDGFRWDYLSRDLTPTINNFADEGVRALSLQPCYPSLTFPNHYSIVTGMYPAHHGLIANSFVNRFTGEKYSLSSSAVTEAKWYTGEAIWETARRNGLITASFFWPGSEMNLEYRRPNYFHKYDGKIPFKTRVDGVAEWFSLPDSLRPQFVTLYFSEPDHTGHEKGPDSPEVNQILQQMDSVFSYLILKMDSLSIKDSLNIIVVSDHGMTSVSNTRTVPIYQYLNGENVYHDWGGAFMMIQPKEEDIDRIYNKLKANERHYKVYMKNELPEMFHYSDNPNITDIVVVAENGYMLIGDANSKMEVAGMHGFDNSWMNMHGIFMAKGPMFKSRFLVGTVKNIDIYPLICHILRIIPNHGIDGKLENIEQVLKEF